MLEIRIGSLSLTGTVPTEGPGQLRIKPKGSVQESPALGAVGITLFARGNYKHTITFEVTRQHADADTAAYFHVDHLEEVEAVGVAFCTYATAEGTKYFLSAFAEVLDSRVEGNRTFHSYQIVAGAISDNQPPS